MSNPCHANGAAATFENVTVALGGNTILESITARIPKGSCTAVVGPNGAGKTTMLLALLGEIPFTGDIRVSRADEGLSLRIGYVPQRIQFDRGMPLTVLEFMVMGRQRSPLWFGVRRECRDRARELLASVKIRVAFFADAISHSAFTGVALGLILSVSPHWTMPIFGLIVGLSIVAAQRRSALSTDTVIGVFFSGVVAFGLAVVSRDRNVARDIQRFLYGDILTIGDGDIWAMIALLAALTIFQVYGYNRMLYIGLNPVVAKMHGVVGASGQDWARTATGATVILVAFGWFLVSAGVELPFQKHRR